jgi:DNA polymerase III subunit delta
MIKKSFELKNFNQNFNILLFYGKNEGAKKEEIFKIISSNKSKTVTNYDEKQILENSENFYQNIFSGSLFDNEKIIIINRATDKLLHFIDEIVKKNVTDIILILNSEILEKKSKLRSLFEKEKKLVCVAFYPDNPETLSRITQKFLREIKVTVSQSNINLLINRCNGDRGILRNELKKIKYFASGNRKITTENILKLTNLIENFSISELIDYCLVKNKKKTINILNENNFSDEDCILIIRVFLNKLKRILKLAQEYENNNDLDKTLSTAKPPIFWKDKDITKLQIKKWKPNQINSLIFELSEIELQIKRSYVNSINIISNFILEKATSEVSNNF